MDALKSQAKPFEISKWEVWGAYREVRANNGAPGVDGQSLAAFEEDLQGNLYKIWNRMSSGTYFPPPVRAVEIPKAHGPGVRTLGVPTVGDRVAQTVVARHLSARLEPVFHPDSYGYRPGRSAHDALERCRRRCWERDWVAELDIKSFFDTVRHDLVIKAVQAHTDAAWVVLYVKRWLTAPLQRPGGGLEVRDRGTPQGSAVSPVLANLYLHYALDMWLAREFPAVLFERYADDAVLHCVSERQARQVLAALGDRMADVGLQLHPGKTRIVYCQDGRRRGSFEHTAFTFLGFTFRQRRVADKHGRVSSGFVPAISDDAAKKIGETIRSWRLNRKVDCTVADLARWVNPIVAGWIQYYGRFYRSALGPLLRRINAYLVRWLRRKYRRLRALSKALTALAWMARRCPALFAHWRITIHADPVW